MNVVARLDARHVEVVEDELDALTGSRLDDPRCCDAAAACRFRDEVRQEADAAAAATDTAAGSRRVDCNSAGRRTVFRRRFDCGDDAGKTPDIDILLSIEQRGWMDRRIYRRMDGDGGNRRRERQTDGNETKQMNRKTQ